MRRALIAGLALALAADSSPFTPLPRPDPREPLSGLGRLSFQLAEEEVRPELLVRTPPLIGYLLQAGIGYDVTRDFKRNGIEAAGAHGYTIGAAGDEYVANVAGPVTCAALFDAWRIPVAERPRTRLSECLLFKYQQRCLKEGFVADASLIFHFPSGTFLYGTVAYLRQDHSRDDEARSFRAYGAALREIEERMLAGGSPLPY
jgi:hypothetical protein